MSGNGEIIDVLSVVVAGESRKRKEERVQQSKLPSLARLLARHKKEIASSSASTSASKEISRHSDTPMFEGMR